MTTMFKKAIKVTAVVMAAVLLFGFAPSNTVRSFAASADPDSTRLPGAFDAAEDGLESLKKQIASLERIIELNVPRAEKIPVLLYHHLVKESEMNDAQRRNDSVLSVEQFSEQMKYLSEHKYYTASLYELERYLSGKMILPERTVVITFDDGYRSNTKYAYPVLKKYGYQAAIFLITSMIGEKENVIEHAGWGDLRKCGDVFSYFSHSHNMHSLRKDGKSIFQTSDSDAITNDLLISKALLSASYMAYPYGQTGRAAKKALTDAGYRMAFTTVASYVTRKSDKLEIPRFTITPNIDIDKFEIICSGLADNATASDEISIDLPV